MKMSPEHKKNLSDSLKANWASGTRKKNPPKTYTKAKIISDKTKARMSIAKLGKPQPPGLCGKGENHWRAKYWILKAPNQQIIQGWNKNELIRKNLHLFDKKDVVWNGNSNCSCLASKGIQSLFIMKKDGTGPRKNSWKGWMAGSIGDIKEGNL